MQFIRQIFIGIGMAAAAGLAQAALITLDGDHFSVSYDDALISPYSGGFLSGALDTVYFQSNTFQASQSTPVDPRALLQLTLTIDPGYAFAGLSFTERGSYFLLGDGAVGVHTLVTLADPSVPASAALDLTSAGLNQAGAIRSWALGGDLGPLGPSATQTLLITLDTTLSADATTGRGLIQNTYAGFQIRTRAAAVPEPSGLSLLLAGMLAAPLVGYRARTRSARASTRSNQR